MTTYRCPACGALHKEEVDHCRLCGSSMDPNLVAFTKVGADQTFSRERFAGKGLGHIMVLGTIIALSIIVGALLAGWGRNDPQIAAVRENVPLLDPEDGWETWEEPEGSFVAEVPDPPTATEDAPRLADSGTNVAYFVTIGEDYELTIGHTQSAALGTDDPAAVLRDAADRLATEVGGKVVSASDSPFEFRDLPTVDVIIDGLRLRGDPAFLSARIMLTDDGELFFAETLSFQQNPPVHSRLASSLEILDESSGATASTSESG